MRSGLSLSKEYISVVFQSSAFVSVIMVYFLQYWSWTNIYLVLSYTFPIDKVCVPSAVEVANIGSATFRTMPRNNDALRAIIFLSTAETVLSICFKIICGLIYVWVCCFNCGRLGINAFIACRKQNSTKMLRTLGRVLLQFLLLILRLAAFLFAVLKKSRLKHETKVGKFFG